ncbi:hypothetical protein J2Z31_005925 [Sinorhizobium kostiense]|uniref:Uncharacterized protein n=1 Tax=Sinorhizobium kostiense TaxID=76747 RepID=A0ABS4R918_9HYPH|nr:hypothetical protein [Sinorhizobium kostiense]
MDGRCGRTIEAKPVSDYTCVIESTAWHSDGRKKMMASAPHLAMPEHAMQIRCHGLHGTAFILEATNLLGVVDVDVAALSQCFLG